MQLSTRYALVRALRWLFVPENVRLSLFERVTDSHYERRIEEAREANDSSNRAQDLRQERNHEMYMLYQDREVLYTKHLLRKARRFRVPIPNRYSVKMEETADWERSWDGEWYLSEAGDIRLRADIRRERKERWEARAHWIGWIAAITGLVGAVTGLIAIILAG